MDKAKEGYSLIIQVGSREDYGESMRTYRAVVNDLSLARHKYKRIDKIFITGGDVLSMDTKELLRIFKSISILFPEAREIYIEGDFGSVLKKTMDQLMELNSAGLKRIFLTMESGNDHILLALKKNIARQEIILACEKLDYFNIDIYVRVSIGLFSLGKSLEHTRDTASLLNILDPAYIIFDDIDEDGLDLAGNLKSDPASWPLTSSLEEVREIIGGLDLEECLVATSNLAYKDLVHARLPGDKERLMEALNREIEAKKSDNNRI